MSKTPKLLAKLLVWSAAALIGVWSVSAVSETAGSSAQVGSSGYLADTTTDCLVLDGDTIGSSTCPSAFGRQLDFVANKQYKAGLFSMTAKGQVSVYVSDPKALLPSYRWNAVSTLSGSYEDLDIDLGWKPRITGVDDLPSKIGAGIAEFLFQIASMFWSWTMALLEYALTLNIIHAMSTYLNLATSAFGTALMQSQVTGLVLVLVLFSVAWVLFAQKPKATRRAAGLLMGFVLPIAALQTLVQAATEESQLTATNSAYESAIGQLDAPTVVGSPSWLGWQGNQLTGVLTGVITDGAGAIQTAIEPALAGSTPGDTHPLHCSWYSAALYDQFKAYAHGHPDYADNPTAISGLEVVSRMWEQGYLTLFDLAQFGDPDAAQRVDCRYFENFAGTWPSEQYVLTNIAATLSGVTLPPVSSGVPHQGTSVLTNGEVSTTIIKIRQGSSGKTSFFSNDAVDVAKSKVGQALSLEYNYTWSEVQAGISGPQTTENDKKLLIEATCLTSDDAIQLSSCLSNSKFTTKAPPVTTPAGADPVITVTSADYMVAYVHAMSDAQAFVAVAVQKLGDKQSGKAALNIYYNPLSDARGVYDFGGGDTYAGTGLWQSKLNAWLYCDYKNGSWQVSDFMTNATSGVEADDVYLTEQYAWVPAACETWWVNGITPKPVPKDDTSAVEGVVNFVRSIPQVAITETLVGTGMEIQNQVFDTTVGALDSIGESIFGGGIEIDPEFIAEYATIDIVQSSMTAVSGYAQLTPAQKAPCTSSNDNNQCMTAERLAQLDTAFKVVADAVQQEVQTGTSLAQESSSLQLPGYTKDFVFGRGDDEALLITGVSDYAESIAGFKMGNKLAAGFMSIIVAIAFLFSFAGLSIGAIFAQIMFFFLLMFLPATLILLASPNKAMGMRLLKMTGSFGMSKVIFVGALALMLALLSISNIFLKTLQ